MRIAIISDIHSNLEGLSKALEIIDRKTVDDIICLGDIIGYGANPNECIELIRKHCSVVLRGNHEDAIANPELTMYFTENARLAIEWTDKELSIENKNYVCTLPLTWEKYGLFFVHSSPCNPERWEYIFSSYQALTAFECFKNPICFVGHTHVPALYFNKKTKDQKLSKDVRCIINVGSVGQPRDRNPKLSLGIFDVDTWNYENIRSEYDVQTAIEKILDTDLPPQLGHRLMFGV